MIAAHMDAALSPTMHDPTPLALLDRLESPHLKQTPNMPLKLTKSPLRFRASEGCPTGAFAA